jgi:hypothetical protein
MSKLVAGLAALAVATGRAHRIEHKIGPSLQVRELDPLVAELDPELHGTVFGRDATITRCLVPPAP